MNALRLMVLTALSSLSTGESYADAVARKTTIQAQKESSALVRRALIESWHIRDAMASNQGRFLGKYAHVFPQPSWLPSLNPFYGRHALTAACSATYSENGFGSDGAMVDSSVVRFGKQPQLGDVLGASAATALSPARTAVGYEFLADLRQIDVPFVVRNGTTECALSYALSFAKEKVSLGITLPLQYRYRSLSVVPHLSSAMQAALSQVSDSEPFRNSQFRGFYGLSVPALVADIAARKNMKYQERLSETVLGDISLSASYHYAPRENNRLSVSAEFLFPGQGVVDTQQFYPCMPESLSCMSVRTAVGFVASKTFLGTPHCMASARFYFPSSLSIRVPRLVQVQSAIALPDTEVFGPEISFYPVATAVIPETTVADFGSKTMNLSVRPGSQIDVRLGSVITPFLSPATQLDVYYRFGVQATGSFGEDLSDKQWYLTALSPAPYRMHHSLGVSVVSQPSVNTTVRLNIESVFAGRSTPLEVKAGIFLSGFF